jgi:pyruvate/2-oxoglutarate dehydrogenase complex dihydrolipoamide dehydrogenase (E3) component
MRSFIGTGQSGPARARRLVAAGQKVAVIERKFFAGTSVNTGCTLTKTLVASAYAGQLARRVASALPPILGSKVGDRDDAKLLGCQIRGR